MGWFTSATSLLVVLFASTILFGNANSASDPVVGQLTQAAATGRLLSLNADLFRQFVLRKDRDYNVVVMFTALEERHGCMQCRAIINDWAIVARAYHARAPHVSAHKRLFFFIVDVGSAANNMALFQEMGVKQVPVISFVSRSKVNGKGDPAQMDAYDFQRNGWSAEHLVAFAAQRVGYVVDLGGQVQATLSRIAPYIGILLFLGVAFTIYKFLSYFWKDPKRLWAPHVWFGVSLVPYSITVAGGIYNAIHPNQWFSQAPDGSIILFSWMHGHQFILEGFLVLGLLLTCCGCVVVLNTSVPRLEDAWRRRLGTIGALCLLFLCFSLVTQAFRQKMGAYPFDIASFIRSVVQSVLRG